MIINPEDRILFIGDSITDTNRNREDVACLGKNGYCALVSGRILADLGAPELPIFNRGINGHKVIDILNRVQKDILDLEPTVISMLLGINDAGNEVNTHHAIEASTFHENYRALLTAIRDKISTQIVLLEPFLGTSLRPELRPYLNPKIDAVRALAVEFGTELIPLDGIFAESCTVAPVTYWLSDGVHPTLAGHTLIADEWMSRAQLEV